MGWYEEPKADTALLAYLMCVTAVLGLFAWSFYALMQPTVVPNAGLAQYKAPASAIFLHRIDTSERIENAAVAAAKQANREQGIEPSRAYASAEPALAAPGALAAKPATSVARQPKQAKPKRVVRREPVRDRWGWEFASGGWFGSAGNRSFWFGGSRGHY
jgi:hypothetical protein